MKRLYIIIYVGLVLASLPLVAYGQLKRVSPRKVHLSEEKLARADSAIMDAIGRGEIPGAVLGIVKERLHGLCEGLWQQAGLSFGGEDDHRDDV